jgi:DNA-binding Lrp family transcriptional regulator
LVTDRIVRPPGRRRGRSFAATKPGALASADQRPVDVRVAPARAAQAGRDAVVHAYILIQTEVGKAAQVAKEVGAVGGVTEAEDVTGPYDVIVRAEAKNVDELGKLVVARIQSVEGITRTLTCPVVHL